MKHYIRGWILAISVCLNAYGDVIQGDDIAVLVKKWETFTLKCEAIIQEPKNGIRWRIGARTIFQYFPSNWADGRFSGKDKYVPDKQGKYVHLLTVKNANYEDVGNYTCETVQHGPHKRHYEVYMFETPHISIPRGRSEGEKIRSYCSVRYKKPAHPALDKMELRIYIGKKQIHEGKTLLEYVKPNHQHQMTRNFSFTGQRNMNGKNLSCIVESSRAENNLSFSQALDIKYPPKSLEVSPRKKSFKIGEVLYCIADANPPPVFIWNTVPATNWTLDGPFLFIFRNMSGKQIWTCSVLNHGGRKKEVQFEVTTSKAEQDTEQADITPSYSEYILLLIPILVLTGRVIHACLERKMCKINFKYFVTTKGVIRRHPAGTTFLGVAFEFIGLTLLIIFAILCIAGVLSRHHMYSYVLCVIITVVGYVLQYFSLKSRDLDGLLPLVGSSRQRQGDTEGHYPYKFTAVDQEDAREPDQKGDQGARLINENVAGSYDGHLKNVMEEGISSVKTAALSITTSPQQLIKISSDKNLELNEQVLSELRKVQGDIVVVTIVGYYRTGKSYLLNHLAGKPSGFKLGSTIEGVTKGIWIMVRPHPTKPDTQLVLLDTEGLGDADGKSPHQDAWIYTLAALFSSTLIHNAFGNINEDTIDQWNFVSEMAKKVSIGRQYMEDDPDFGMYFPKFILTLREFTLTLTKGGKEITADEHMESILSQKANRKPEYNEKRTMINRYFPDKKCFLFERPAEKREQLAKLDSIGSEDLSEDFKENVLKFLEFVYNECGPLQLPNGHKMDGAALVTLIQHYVKALNQDEGLSIESAVGKVIHEETKKAIENAEKSYRKYMADHVPLPTKDLLTFANGTTIAFDLARKSFVESIVPGQQGEDLELFQDKMATIRKEFDSENKRLSKEKCLAKLHDLEGEMQHKLLNNGYIKLGGYTEFKMDMQYIEDKYRGTCDLGTEKEDALSDYLGQFRSVGEDICSTDEQMTEIERKYEAENMRKLAADRLRKRGDTNQEKEDRIQKGIEEVTKVMLKDLEEKRKKELEDMQRRFEYVQRERRKHVSRLQEEGLKEQAKMWDNFINEQNKRFTHRREQLDELATKFKKQQ